MPGAYSLEVSSPGIERPVERAEDFARFTGFRARIKLGPSSERRNATGVLRGLEGDVVVLDVQGELLKLPLMDVDRVHLDLTLEEFERLVVDASSTETLEASAKRNSINLDRYFSLVRRQFSKWAPSLRDRLDDQFERYFNDCLGSIKASVGPESPELQRTKEVEDALNFLRMAKQL